MAHIQQASNQSLAKIEELESIRGLAALLVVFFHMPKWNSFLDVGIVNNGYLMVELFFVLSGYVIYNAYSRKITSRRDLIRFQFLRLGRLYPVHVLFLLAFVLVELAKYFSQSKIGASPVSVPFEKNNLTAFIQQLFLMQAIGPTGNGLTFNAPAWSISVEFYTYLLFGVCLLSASKIKEVVFFLVAVISVLLLSRQLTFGFEDLLRCTAGFFIGCITHVIVERLRMSPPKYFSLLVLICMVFFLQLKTNKHYDAFIYLFSALLMASLVLEKNGYLNILLNVRVLTWLGSVSYALYMSHFFVIWGFDMSLRRILKFATITSGNGYHVAQLSAGEAILVCAALIATVLFLSAFVFEFVEKPMRAKSRRFAFDKLS